MQDDFNQQLRLDFYRNNSSTNVIEYIQLIRFLSVAHVHVALVTTGVSLALGYTPLTATDLLPTDP